MKNTPDIALDRSTEQLARLADEMQSANAAATREARKGQPFGPAYKAARAAWRAYWAAVDATTATT